MRDQRREMIDPCPYCGTEKLRDRRCPECGHGPPHDKPQPVPGLTPLQRYAVFALLAFAILLCWFMLIYNKGIRQKTKEYLKERETGKMELVFLDKRNDTDGVACAVLQESISSGSRRRTA